MLAEMQAVPEPDRLPLSLPAATHLGATFFKFGKKQAQPFSRLSF